MDEKSRDEIKAIIDEQIIKTKQNIENLKESAKPISPSNAIGRLSRMEAINDKSVMDAAIRQSKRHLEGLNRAIDMIKKSDYGECLECGEEITLQRLKSVPYSVVCMDCFRNNT